MIRLIAIALVLCTKPIAAEPYPFKVYTQQSDQVHNLIAINQGPAPIYTRVEITNAVNVNSPQAWPVSAVVPPMSQVFLASLYSANPRYGNSFQFKYSHSIGSPNAAHSPAAIYRMPYPDGSQFRIGQAYGGYVTTHTTPDSFYAIDITMPKRTPVLAARAGMVVDKESRYGDGAKEEYFRDKANHITILHDDGTFAEYAHLEQNSIYVWFGQRVQEGSVIALSGNSGYSSGPHLHFAILKATESGRTSLPFRFYSKARGTFTPSYGMTVLADYSLPARSAPQTNKIAQPAKPVQASLTSAAQDKPFTTSGYLSHYFGQLDVFMNILAIVFFGTIFVWLIIEISNAKKRNYRRDDQEN
ncbi:MAG: M23 family metallopeptidase [Sulfuricella sp.]|nr:M23 family metallopeptidase [Sulfuricella sp.]